MSGQFKQYKIEMSVIVSVFEKENAEGAGVALATNRAGKRFVKSLKNSRLGVGPCNFSVTENGGHSE